MQDIPKWITVKGKLNVMLSNSSVLVDVVLHVCLDQVNHKDKSLGIIRVFTACLALVIGMKSLLLPLEVENNHANVQFRPGKKM